MVNQDRPGSLARQRDDWAMGPCVRSHPYDPALPLCDATVVAHASAASLIHTEP